ncbi:MAG: PD-(D/E)XK nuclease family protein [Gammaproteobacteria bacterium]
MNIFTVLNQGNSRLHETSISAVLAYFLNPKADHGLGSAFLQAFLNHRGINKLLPENYSVVKSEVELERAFPGNNNIDIVIDLCNDSGEIVHCLIIENKINPDAANETQLTRYYKAARGYEDYNKNRKVAITVVFITPAKKAKKLTDEFNHLTKMDKKDKKVELHWTGPKSGKDSIQKIIREEILKKESMGEISPIGEYVKHTLKAFAMHLSEDNDYEFLNIGEYKIRLTKKISRYHVYQNGEQIEAKQALRKMIKLQELVGVSEETKKKDGTDRTKSTWELARDVWDAYKEKMKNSR